MQIFFCSKLFVIPEAYVIFLTNSSASMDSSHGDEQGVDGC
jgi:hypothetical protein